jgi:anti-sigma regulatory factor (Ser/Thr protein kinase)
MRNAQGENMAPKKEIPKENYTPIVKIAIEKEDFVHAGEASSQIKERLLKLGYTPQAIRRVAIASFEAELNIVIHSLGGEIEAAIRPQTVRIIARDRGPGIKDIPKAMQKGFSTAPPHIQQMGFGAGMGLPNMEHCCDEFQIQSEPGEGTTVTMVIREVR